MVSEFKQLQADISFYESLGLSVALVGIALSTEKELSEATGTSYTTRARANMAWVHTSPDSPLFCDGCHKYLGFWRVMRSACFKKQGQKYLVRCPCGHISERVKGMLSKQFDDRFKEVKP